MRPSLRPAAPSKVLRLLAEKYPTRAAVESRLIYLQGQLVLPKGVEHFMSDLHGEYAAFFHILNNCSGVIREKVDYVFGARLSGEEIWRLRADEIIRNCLCLIDDDGRGHAAYVYPYRLNEARGELYDEWANDQDLPLYDGCAAFSPLRAL